MPFFEADSIRYYAFDSMLEAGIIHAMITRRGGISPEPWAALNLGGTVGDDPARVRINRQRAFSALGCVPESLYDVWQVHGANVVCADAPRAPNVSYQKADAIFTDSTEVTLFMRFADCVPILLYDPRRRVVGLVHAGWQGTVNRILAAAIEVMKRRYSSIPADVLAGFGPSICPRHYEVGSEVVDHVRATFGSEVSSVISNINGSQNVYKARLDLWTANRIILEQSGVDQIEMSEICTACHMDDWYSHRGENGKTGRFGVIIRL